MRISVDMGDPGYAPNWHQFGVVLNDRPVINTITADEELGLVRLAVADEQGRQVEKVLFGNVKIERVH